MAQLNFNAETVAPQQAFENLPNGWYLAKIIESEMKPASTPGASYLELVHEVIAPEQYAGRKLWNRLNLVNANETAVKIAYETLSAICHATGVIQCADSQMLHERPLEVKVGLSKVTEAYPEARNEIKGYRAVQGTGAAAPGMAAPAAAPAPAPMAAPAAMAQPAAAPTQPVAQPAAAPVATQPVAQPAQPAPVAAQPQAEAAPVAQPAAAEQPAWAAAQPQQAAPAAQPEAAAPAQPAPQQIETAQQPATDPAAQQAAAVSKAPWEQ